MTVEELFECCTQLAKTQPSSGSLRQMHETLVLCCAEGIKQSGTGFGNLFSQVDFLCKHHGIKTPLRMAVQQMRRRSNHTDIPTREQWLQDVRALAQFVSAVFNTAVPGALVSLIPHEEIPVQVSPTVNMRYLRCIVRTWDTATIQAETTGGQLVDIDYAGQPYLQKMLREGMQLNLLDSHMDDSHHVKPGLVVVEPDFLVDISSVARCFQGEYGHHPLLYTVERLRKRSNSQAILLGNFAGTALDNIIHQQDFHLGDSLTQSFREQALQFCTCEDFNPDTFIADAERQVAHIRQAKDALFNTDQPGYDREKALLEPSFVCEQLGLQGRVDLMTSDMRLLVEQKSGKNYSIEHGQTIRHKEDHYVQLLLYYGILRYNFGRTDRQVDIRLLYSRYPAEQGLLYVNFYRQLFQEAICLRNKIVATEQLIAREGFGRILPVLTPAVIYRDTPKDGFYYRYIEPQLQAVTRQLLTAAPLERAYFERMMTFVYREQLLQKVGRQEGQGSAGSDLWNMPLSEKIETGNIILRGKLSPTLNFRRGDMVYLYNYDGEEPDVRKAILYKGTLQAIGTDGISVQLQENMRAETIMQQGPWAIEHASSDQNTTSAIKSLYQLLEAPADRRALLLGQRAPRRDRTLTLSRHYHDDYDGVLTAALQSRDYFLLVGPPGTGKTSMALRFLVTEELLRSQAEGKQPSLLLMAYTNRAVDEICAMLDDAGHDYLRIGSDTSCDPRFLPHLLNHHLGASPKLDDIRRQILSNPIIVGTTSMLQARPYIFQLRQFTLTIIDEASQILEPGLIGLLSSPCTGRFILVGDHKQLPAVVQQDEKESAVDHPLLNAIGMTDCRHSLFERLLHWEQHSGRTEFTGILRKQGRMHPDIAAFPNAMFYHKEQLEPVPLKHQTDTSLHYDLPSTDGLDDLLKQHRVLFIDSSTPDSPVPPVSDKVNAAEARIVARLLQRIHRFYGARFDARKTVGVIVPYRNQITMIREEAARRGLPDVDAITIDTVERYQGSQRDVIIYSFTITRAYQLDFLTSNCFQEEGYTIDRKLNVAMTRARKQLLMTGNVPILSRNGIFKHLIAQYQKNI